MVSLKDILGTTDGNSVQYISAQDASSKIGQIADSIRTSTNSEALGLDLLLRSIEALQVSN